NPVSDAAQAGGAAIAGGAAAAAAGAGATWARFRQDDEPAPTHDWNVTGDAWGETTANPPAEGNALLGDLAGNVQDQVSETTSTTSNWVNDAVQSGGTAIAGGAAAGGGAAAAWNFISGKGQAETSETPIDLGSNWQTPPEVSETTNFTPPTAQWDFGNAPELNVNPSNLTPPDAPNLGDMVSNMRDRVGDVTGSVSEATDKLNSGMKDKFANLASEGGNAVTNLFGRVKEGVGDLASGAAQVGGDTLATGAAIAGGAAAAVGGTAAAARARLSGEELRTVGSRIVLLPQTPREAIVRWQLSEEQKSTAHSQGGIDLALRLYDCTGLNPDTDRLENYYQYDCSELTQELRIEVPVPDRDYVVEVGYLDRVGEWLGIARSPSVRMPVA
ncbi:MAG: DUF4912 domain-containing protein, partial [Synechococcales bacterium]|nr:DUF4912 domain-containing protein [Synechococcales bacterium]